MSIYRALIDAKTPEEIGRAIYPIARKRERAGRQHADRPLRERLIFSVALGASECWNWVRVRNEFGYGRMTYEGRTQVAHRLSWIAFNGPIPDGMYVLHKCDNPSCINPEHLWLGTYSDNRRDCLNKGRWRMTQRMGKAI